MTCLHASAHHIAIDPLGCQARGPGVGGASVRKMVAIMLWIQALLWIAFLLLPFTGKLNPRSGKINYTRSRRKWADAWQFAEEQELQRYKTKLRRAARRAVRHDKVLYQRLKVEEHAELAVEKLGTGYVQQMDEEARGAHEKKLLELRRGCAERYDQTTLVGWLQARLALCHKYFDAVTYPMRCTDKQNRLVLLLHWDTFAFALCVLIFLILSVWSYWAREVIAAEADSRNGQPLLHTLLLISDMMSIFSDSFWDDWHTQISFQIVKVIFSLSAVPFFLFTIGPLAKLFSHTDATAYMPDGRLTLPDPNGQHACAHLGALTVPDPNGLSPTLSTSSASMHVLTSAPSPPHRPLGLPSLDPRGCARAQLGARGGARDEVLPKGGPQLAPCRQECGADPQGGVEEARLGDQCDGQHEACSGQDAAQAHLQGTRVQGAVRSLLPRPRAG